METAAINLLDNAVEQIGARRILAAGSPNAVVSPSVGGTNRIRVKLTLGIAPSSFLVASRKARWALQTAGHAISLARASPSRGTGQVPDRLSAIDANGAELPKFPSKPLRMSSSVGFMPELSQARFCKAADLPPNLSFGPHPRLWPCPRSSASTRNSEALSTEATSHSRKNGAVGTPIVSA